MPCHFVDVFKLKEVCRDHDVEHVAVIDLINHLAPLLIVGRSEESDDVLECFKVARECDLDSFVIVNSFNDGPEVLDISQSPLFIEQDLFVG